MGHGTGRPPPGREPDRRRELARWPLADGDHLVVEAQEFGGRTVVDVRRWYLAREGLRPGRAGVAVPLDRAADLARILETAEPLPPPVRLGALLRAPDEDDAPTERRAEPSERRTTGRVLMGFGTRAWVSPPPTPKVAEPPPEDRAPTPAPPPDEQGPPQSATMLRDIIASGLVRAPLPLLIKTQAGRMSGAAYDDGSLMFGNLRFATPREAVAKLKRFEDVVDAWSQIQYLNPQTRRYAKLSRLRSRYLGLAEIGAEEE